MKHNPLYRDFTVRQRRNGDNLLQHQLCGYSQSTVGVTLAHLVEMAETHITECEALPANSAAYQDGPLPWRPL